MTIADDINNFTIIGIVLGTLGLLAYIFWDLLSGDFKDD